MADVVRTVRQKYIRKISVHEHSQRKSDQNVFTAVEDLLGDVESSEARSGAGAMHTGRCEQNSIYHASA